MEEMQKGGEMKQMVPAKKEGVVAKTGAYASRAARGLRRALVSGIAVLIMMVAYGVSTIGAIGTSALGITGAATVATLAASTTPASAHRWRRRRSYGYYPYRRRRSYGYYPYRRRRRGGIYLYF